MLRSFQFFENRISYRLSREGRDVKLNPSYRSECGKINRNRIGDACPEGHSFGISLWSPLC